MKLQPEEKTRQRQQLAQPVLDDLKAWLEKNSTRVPRDSLTYKAIQYTLNQWELLIGYLADGRGTEYQQRPGGKRHPTSLCGRTPELALCRYPSWSEGQRHHLQPDRDGQGQWRGTVCLPPHVLQHIGNARTVEDIEALLPWNTPVKKMQ